ncbi:MAG: leucine-rich repeat domain-containing protein, partial [Bacteroidales bacterium]|nr:leucine-rich repeat domain-containing protein [Bacteroidales bacterium]
KAKQERERIEAEKQEKKRPEIVSAGLLFKPAEGGYSVAGSGSFRGPEMCIPAEHNGSPVVSVGSEAFHACMFLRKLSVPGTVKKIADSAFWGCENLIHVVLSDGLVSIGTDVFNDCKNLRSISIPDSVKSLGESAFCGCSSLGDVRLPKGLTSLNDDMFGECASLRHIRIPEKVSAIKGSVFDRCTALESIVIPYSVTSIGGYAFSGCKNLRRIYYTGTREDWTVISIGNGNKSLLTAERYYYSEEKPSEDAEYWHYDMDGNPVPW